jgi:bacterioferritin
MGKKADKKMLVSLRDQACQHSELGAVTPGYAADRIEVLNRLNQALATELVCTLRYRRHYFMARGIHAKSISAEFLAHSQEELAHADRLAARIVQLGGEPNFSPDSLTQNSHAQYIECSNLADMISENLIAERIAIESYRDTIAYLGSDDPTTSDMLKWILAMEEEHADDLSSLLNSVAVKS